MKPKGGVTLIIAVGGGKPPHHGDSAHSELKTANGQPIEYVAQEAPTEEEDLGTEGDMLRAMAEAEDEEGR